MVRNYHALWHKYRISSMKPHTLETSKAEAAHAAVLETCRDACAGERSSKGKTSWNVGERVLALRHTKGAKGQVDLDGEWFEATILKVKAKPSGKTTYKVK